jgi:hypothetical protein
MDRRRFPPPGQATVLGISPIDQLTGRQPLTGADGLARDLASRLGSRGT